MSRQPTVRDILRKTEDYLSGKSVDSPRLSAQLILSKGLGLSRLDLFMAMDRPLSPAELDVLRPLAARRGRGEPAAYIAGEREFRSLAFEVCPDVLIPRPETELLVEQAVSLFAPNDPIRFADLGTGSGCLAVTLATIFPAASGLALDASPEALEVARRNASRHGVGQRLTFVRADFSDLEPVEGGYHLIVSNPPYVDEAEYQALSPEVRLFEPRLALTPGHTGLEAYPAVLASARQRLAPGGWLVVEIGCGQGGAVGDLFRQGPEALEDVSVLKDLAGLDRVVMGRKAD